jgi:hypothetical protein
LNRDFFFGALTPGIGAFNLDSLNGIIQIAQKIFIFNNDFIA